MRDSRSQETAGGVPIRLKRRTNLGSLSHWGIESGVNESGGTKTEAAPREAASTPSVLIVIRRRTSLAARLLSVMRPHPDRRHKWSSAD
jgi:hypothetical protein